MSLNIRMKKKITTKDGEAISYLPLDASGTNWTILVLVVISFYIKTT